MWPDPTAAYLKLGAPNEHLLLSCDVTIIGFVGLTIRVNESIPNSVLNVLLHLMDTTGQTLSSTLEYIQPEATLTE